MEALDQDKGIVAQELPEVDRLARLWARFPGFWEPKVSDNGAWLAWTWTGISEAGNVWIVATDGSAPPARLTDEQDHTYVRSFSRDCRYLLLAQSEGASEHDHLILLDRAGGGARKITPPQDDHYVFGGTFTPDGKHILYTASYDDSKKSAIEGQRIYLHDLGSGDRRCLSASDTLESHAPEFSADGRLVLYHRSDRHPAGAQIWLLDLASGEDREILNAGNDRKAYGKWLGPGHILVHAEAETHDRVGVLDLSTARLEWLIDDPQRSIENVLAGRDARTIALVDFELGKLRAGLFDVVTRTERKIRHPGVSLLPIGQLPSGDWIWEQYNSTAPHELVLIESKTGATTSLSRTLDHLDAPPSAYAAARPWRWKSIDGMEIDGWLYEPRGKSRGLIAHIHGGPTWHSEDWIENTIQFLAGIGFTVLDPNYRGSTGYGRGFREAIKQDGWGGREQADIRAGIESLVSAGKATPGRIGVAGLSYGGFSSWYQITKAADLVSAAMPICGMYHLTIDYDETGMPHGRAYSEEMMGGSPAEQPERYFNASPANFIDRIKGKLLIVHGLRDTNVAPENSLAGARELDGAGIPYELLTFANEGHGIHRAGNRETLFRRMAEFFTQAFEKR